MKSSLYTKIRKRYIRPVRDIFIYICIRLFSLIFAVLPLRCVSAIGERFGDIAYCFAVGTRKKALDNLRLVFADEKSEEEYKGICRRLFRNICRNAVEMMKIRSFIARGFEGLVETEGAAILEKLKGRESGVVLLTPHFGNWELLPHYFKVKYDLDICVMARHLRNRYMDTFVHNIRSVSGLEFVYRKEGVRSLIRALRAKKFLGLLPDVVVSGVNSLEIDFLGHKTYVPTGPVELALLTGAPLLVAFVIRSEGRYIIKVEEPVYVDTSIEKEKAVKKYTLAWNSLMEKYIRQYPDHWVWMHKKWDNV